MLGNELVFTIFVENMPIVGYIDRVKIFDYNYTLPITYIK